MAYTESATLSCLEFLAGLWILSKNIGSNICPHCLMHAEKALMHPEQVGLSFPVVNKDPLPKNLCRLNFNFFGNTENFGKLHFGF